VDLEQTWYLTNNAGSNALVDFSGDDPAVTCNGDVGVSTGFEGTAVFTNPSTGELLLYTDGITLLHGPSGMMVDNGDNLTGNTSTNEPAVITPVPGADGTFYVFTNNTQNAASGQLSYSIVDLEDGPQGTVTEKNVEFYDGSPGEALDIVPHADDPDALWLLTYDGAAEVLAFEVDADGVSDEPVRSDLELEGQVLRASINHSEDFDRLALSAYQGANGFLAVADIDRGSGEVSNVEVVRDTGEVGYHLTFSPDSTKLYYAVGSEGYSGQPHQYDLSTDTETQLSTESGFGAAKLAPDGQVYFARWSQVFLGVVEQPDMAGEDASFVVEGLDLSPCTSGYSVPNQTATYTNYTP